MKILLTAATLLIAVPVQAALNKWVDADGKVHYSDGPAPTGNQVQLIRQRATPAQSSPQTPPKSLEEREIERKKAQLARERKEQESAEQEGNATIRRKNCQDAQRILGTLESGGRLATQNEQGERVYLDEEMISQRKQEARRIMQENCD